MVVDFGAERDHDPGIFDGMFANLGHGKLWECLGGGLRSWSAPGWCVWCCVSVNVSVLIAYRPKSDHELCALLRRKLEVVPFYRHCECAPTSIIVRSSVYGFTV